MNWKALKHKSLPLAFFTGTLALFIYLSNSKPVGASGLSADVMTLKAIFTLGMGVNLVATLLLRGALVWLAGFSVAWLVLTFWGLREDPEYLPPEDPFDSLPE
jgi:hypothetical protein